MRNFREMHIWTQGIDLAVEAYRIIKQLPKEEEYGLKSQIRRAAISPQISQKDVAVQANENSS